MITVIGGRLTLPQQVHAKKIGAIYGEVEPVEDDGAASTCFYCYVAFNKNGEHAVTWLGSNARIFLHAACVARLVTRLLNDLHKVECITNQRLVLENES